MNFNDIYDMYYKMPHPFNLSRNAMKDEHLFSYLKNILNYNKEFRFRSLLLLTDISRFIDDIR